MPSLEVIWLSGNNISDLRPLAKLSNLTYLSFDYNDISDLSPLAELTGLYGLSLSYNEISDIGPLAGLTALERLDLAYNKISDIRPLAGLTCLEKIELNSNPISDFGPLAGLPNLAELYLDDDGTNDIDRLHGSGSKGQSGEECPVCDGSGKCPKCGGYVWVYEFRYVTEYVNGSPVRVLKNDRYLCDGEYCFDGGCERCGGDGYLD